ncbi:MAG: hypothetical protein QM831_30710 [Kofleriaceae bacterium]
MRGFAVATLLIVSCGSEPRSPFEFQIPPLPTPPAPAPKPKPLPPIVTSVHGTLIDLVAASDDGTAALSRDKHGEVRLWPTLDGTREPIVVHAPSPPVDLAIASMPAGYRAAFVDQSDTLSIQSFDRAGHFLEQTQIDQPAIAVFGTSHGILALATDRTLVFVDAQNHTQRLATPERILAVVYRNGRALALHDAPKHRIRGRWISITDHGIALDGESPELAIDPRGIRLDRLALSPDHRHLAEAGNGSNLLAFDLESATIQRYPVGFMPLAYLDDDSLAATDNDSITIFDTQGKRTQHLQSTSLDAFAAGAGQLVWADGNALALSDAKTTHYLGYRVSRATAARPGALGLELMDVQFHSFVDDKGKLVATIKTPEVADTLLDWTDLSPKLHAQIVDTQYTHVLRVNNKDLTSSGDIAIHFDPASHVLAAASEGETVFYQVTGDKLGPELSLKTSASSTEFYVDDTKDPYDKIYFTDPALAGGAFAMVAHKNVIHHVRVEDLQKHVSSTTTKSARKIVTIDRAGHIYTRDKKQNIVIDDKITLADTKGTLDVVPSADGSLVALRTAEHLALWSTDGTQKWSIASTDKLPLAWAGPTDLVRLSGGMEHFDLATGAITNTCGWAFGLYDSYEVTNTETDLVCER